MTEKNIFFARAVVYYFDTAKKTWAPSPIGNGFARVDMYENSSNNTFRVIGRGLQDTSKIVINSSVTKDIGYSRASETFHQWSDGRYIYGLNFASKEEAETFGSGFEGVVKRLKETGSGTIRAQPALPTAPAPAPATSSSAPTAPTAPAAPKAPPAPTAPTAPPAPPTAPPAPPGPPPAPKAPAPPPAPKASPSGEGSEDRGALLSSITSFSKTGLKKTVTVDKSGPLLTEPKKDSAAAVSSSSSSSSNSSSSSSSSSGTGMGGMMAEIMAKRKAMGNTEPKSSPPRNDPPAPAPKPTPTIPANKTTATKASTPSAPKQPTPVASAEKSSSNSSENLDLSRLKEEILSEIRKELAAMKEEILDAIRSK